MPVPQATSAVARVKSRVSGPRCPPPSGFRPISTGSACRDEMKTAYGLGAGMRAEFVRIPDIPALLPPRLGCIRAIHAIRAGEAHPSLR